MYQFQAVATQNPIPVGYTGRFPQSSDFRAQCSGYGVSESGMRQRTTLECAQPRGRSWAAGFSGTFQPRFAYPCL